MKNQYFGDLNDYRKYGLLRALQTSGTLKLLVAWMLTPNDGGSDGRLRSYLRRPDQWKQFDQELYQGLASLLESARDPHVSLLERSDLLPRASFFSQLVPDRRGDRDIWRAALCHTASTQDLVFLDPDKGIEVPSKPVGRKGSSKYVT